MSTIALIIPAAGTGSRLNHDTPKPYLPLGGRPVLAQTLLKFLQQKGLRQIVVATSAAYVKSTRLILESVLPDEMNSEVVEGGKERQHSIFNALNVVGDVDLVMIHDAVRPFVSSEQIESCCNMAEKAGGAVLGIPAKDTIKRVGEDGIILDTPSREQLWQTQTPQVFRKDILMEAYRRAYDERFEGTDDSSLVERLGYSVRMVEGDHTNFKITYPLDLKLAKILFEEEQEK